MRLTNKRIIEKLLPLLKKYLKEFQAGKYSLDDFDWWNGERYFHEKHEDHDLWIHDVDNKYFWLGVSMNLDGKYENASLDVKVGKYTKKILPVYEKDYEKPIALFAKYIRGTGNGYFADVDLETGKILEGEWD